MDELIEMHEQEQDIEELESLFRLSSIRRLDDVVGSSGLEVVYPLRRPKVAGFITASLGHQSLPPTNLGRVDEEMASSHRKKNGTYNMIEEVVDLARQINLEVYSDDMQELLDSRNQELTIDEFIEIHEQEPMA
ncbi:hypothetical protein TNCV_3842333 [Trichonephila clavipes]|nr:hypothetical protein TNCV_3842333 [Trichonephila clavipes]